MSIVINSARIFTQNFNNKYFCKIAIYIYMNNICNFNFFFLTLSERGKERNIFL